MAATAGRQTHRSATELAALTLAFVLIWGCRSTPPDKGRAGAQPSGGTPAAELSQLDTELVRTPREHRAWWELARRKEQFLAKLGRQGEALAWLGTLDTKRAPAHFGARLEADWASIQIGRGQLRDADAHLVKSIAISHSAGEGLLEARLRVRRAFVLIKLEELAEAEDCLTQADRYAEAHAGTALEPYIRHYRGLVLWKTNRFEEALGPLTQSASEFQRKNQSAEAGNVLVSLATCYFRLGRFDKARELYEQATGMVEEKDRHLGIGHLGDIFFEERQFGKAAERFERAAALAEPAERDYHALWLTNLATALAEQGKWEKAERVNNEALQVEKTMDRPLGHDHTLVNAARIESGRGDYRAAEKRLTIMLKQPDVDLGAALDASSALARLYDRTSRPTEARQQFEAALKLADASRAKLQEDENKLSLLASLISLHQDYVRFLMDRHQTREALAVAESSRARLLRERMNLPHGGGVATASLGDYMAAARSLDATLLSYWVAPGQSYVWAITGSGLTGSEIAGEAELRALVERYQASVETPEHKEGREAGEKLFALLLGVIPGGIKAGGRYIVVPDGPLCALNFETLRKAGRYWIEAATIAVTPSLNVLVAARLQPKPGRSLLVLGDAAEWDDNFPKLINARKEIEAIGRRFPADPTRVLTGPAATPAAYVAARPADYSYIHFSAHATANRNAPMESAIILSAANGNGRLSVRDVLRTPVRANLVTISACRTAGARTYAGEGLVGLAWAFVQSGARQVVAGLWNVNDYASPKLVEELYAGIADGKLPVDALRAAKLKLMAGGKYAEPYYWGALQLYLGALR